MGLGTCEAGRASMAMGMSVIFTMPVPWAECRLRLYLKGVCVFALQDSSCCVRCARELGVFAESCPRRGQVWTV